MPVFADYAVFTGTRDEDEYYVAARIADVMGGTHFENPDDPRIPRPIYHLIDGREVRALSETGINGSRQYYNGNYAALFEFVQAEDFEYAEATLDNLWAAGFHVCYDLDELYAQGRLYYTAPRDPASHIRVLNRDFVFPRGFK